MRPMILCRGLWRGAASGGRWLSCPTTQCYLSRRPRCARSRGPADERQAPRSLPLARQMRRGRGDPPVGTDRAGRPRPDRGPVPGSIPGHLRRDGHGAQARQRVRQPNPCAGPGGARHRARPGTSSDPTGSLRRLSLPSAGSASEPRRLFVAEGSRTRGRSALRGPSAGVGSTRRSSTPVEHRSTPRPATRSSA